VKIAAMPNGFPQFRELFFNVYGNVLDFVVILQRETQIGFGMD